jgi:hypothetical protein
MIRSISSDEWRNFLAQYSRAHHDWIVTVHATADGEIARARGRLSEVRWDGDTPFDAIHIELLDGPTIYLPHPVELRVQERADGAVSALEIERADGAVLRIAFRATAIPEEIDGIAPGEHRWRAHVSDLVRTVGTAVLIVLVSRALADSVQ